MGQYFVVANLDKKVSFSPDGLKFIEHAFTDDYSVEKVMLALSTIWKKQRVIWCGDYADDNKPYDYEEISLKENEKDYLSAIGFLLKRYTDITHKIFPVEDRDFYELPNGDYEKTYYNRIKQFETKKIIDAF